MLTPEDRYALQAVLAELEAASAGIRAILDLGENPYLTREQTERYIQQAKAAASGPVCTCDFGWQPDCPQHGIEDHQPERVCRCADTGRPSMCPKHRDPDAQHGIEDHQDERPRHFLDRATEPPARDDHEVVSPQEARTAFMRSHRPTPRDVFGAREEDQVGG